MTLTIAAAVAGGAAITALVLSLAGGLRSVALFEHPDREDLEALGWARGVLLWEWLRALVTATLLLIAMATGVPAALALLGVIGPSVVVRVRSDAVHQQARRSMTNAVRTTEGALRSGATLPEALRRAASELDRGPRGRLAAAIRSFDLGTGLDTALVHAAGDDRDGRIALVFGTMALGIGERLPRDRMADLLGSLGGRLAHEDAIADEIRARASGARQQQWLLAALVPAVALFLVSTMPTLAAALDTTLGRNVLIPAAIGLEVGGILLGRQIVREALR